MTVKENRTIDLDTCINQIRMRLRYNYSREQIINDLESIYGNDTIYLCYHAAEMLEKDRLENFTPADDKPESVRPVRDKKTVPFKRPKV